MGSLFAHRRFVDRPVASPPERLHRARRQQHLHEALFLRALVDLGHGDSRVFLRHGDRGAEALVEVAELADLPVVHRRAERRAVIEVALVRAAAPERDQDSVLDAIRIEMLLAHELGVRARRRAVFRPRIEARNIGRHARMREPFRQSLPHVTAERCGVLLPALGHEREQLGRRFRRRMDVAIDEAELLLGILPRFRFRFDVDVHCRISFGASGSRSRE